MWRNNETATNSCFNIYIFHVLAYSKTRLIGWGYFDEDLASLIADEAGVENMVEYYQKCVPAYYKGFSEYADISHVTAENCVRELILVMFGYRLVVWYKFAKSLDEKTLHLNTLYKIYEMGQIPEISAE